MKILYLITKGERGGAQSHLLTLMQLQRYGMPVLAMGEDGVLGDEARLAGIPVHIVPHFGHAIRPLQDVRAVGELILLIRREQPNVIHAHTAKAGLLARLAGFLTGTPTIYTVHAWSFVSIASPLMRGIAIGIERSLSLMNQAVIDVSQSNYDMAKRTGVAPRDCHFVIRNGVADTPHRATFTSGAIEIVMVARFAPPKDQCLLLEALAPLPGEWRCSFVGDGPELSRARTRACDLGIQERVRFLGDRDDVPAILAASQVFVLCSNSESLPISILEAMRAGLPVISSDVGGCAELVEHGVTGLLARAGNALDLRKNLARLLDSTTLRAALGRAGRAAFETHFGVDGMVRQTVQAYLQITSGVAVRLPDRNLHAPTFHS